MTAQEKAKELIEKFYNQLESIVWKEESYPKQCALIAVEEIITALMKTNPDYEKNTYWSIIDYYEEVKQEIEKL